MKSFKTYAEQTTGATEKDQTQTYADASSAEELTKRIAATYNGKSNADMLRSILSEAEKSKRAGTLSNEEIENFYQTFSPMLDGHQRKKLRSVVDKLKAIP